MVRQRNAMLERARSFFRSRDVLEVDTPALGRCTTSDPNIDSLRVAGPGGATLYLQTSPESFMKRLLADGYPDIYEICRVFREGESGRLHQPEFTMVEWYRHGFGLGAMIDETVAFIADLLQQPELADAEWLEYETAFRRFANIEPFAASLDELADAANADASLRESLGDDRDAWLDLLLGTYERRPELRWRAAHGVAAFPCEPGCTGTCLSGRRQGGRPLRGISWRGGTCQWLRRAARRERATATHACGPRLPECAGVAVGFERLLMLATGAADIRDVLTFALDDKDD
jgi:lysyl-tRNA synthetase class 2